MPCLLNKKNSSVHVCVMCIGPSCCKNYS